MAKNSVLLVLAAAVVLTGCGVQNEYDPELCSLWTDMHNLTESGDSRVEMDRYCTR